MPLFRRESPSHQQRYTVNGRPQGVPETIGGMPRRFRLFIEVERRLAAHPLAQADAFGVPVGDGTGLEDVVSQIRPLFEQEKSLIRWVALRGALTEMYLRLFDPEEAVESVDRFEAAMGIRFRDPAKGVDGLQLSAPWDERLSESQRQAALGIAASSMLRTVDYPRISTMGVQEVLDDANCQRMSHLVALDIMAWSAIGLLRCGIAQYIMPEVPEPDAMTAPGWYTEPLFAKAERYWDGDDWSAAVRRGDGYQESRMPLV
jgi:hypothetical protein